MRRLGHWEGRLRGESILTRDKDPTNPDFGLFNLLLRFLDVGDDVLVDLGRGGGERLLNEALRHGTEAGVGFGREMDSAC